VVSWGEPWARDLASWREEGADAFVCFNGDGGGAAVADALALAELG
jgi:uncharacterized protein YecE (DUF72 family)